MKLSKITKDQALKIGKAALYLGISAALSALISALADDPDLFGPLTPIINIALVTLKQLFSGAK